MRTRRLRRFDFARTVGVTLVFWATASFAQTETATIRGRVTDPTGALVQSNGPPDRYWSRDQGPSREQSKRFLYVCERVSGSISHGSGKEGFKLINLTGITVNVQDNLEENFRLDVGAVSESLTVEAGAHSLMKHSG
jgi:hypothetical protein